MSLKELFDNIADFFPNFIMFFLQFFIFYQKKKKKLVLSKSLLYALIFGKNMHKGLIFLASFYPIRYLKLFLQKGTLLDTTILLISIGLSY